MVEYISGQGNKNDGLGNEYGRKFRPSPIFSFSNSGTIASNGTDIFDFGEDNTASQKYLPFNNLRIVNNSSEDIKVYINQNRNKFVLVTANSISLATPDVFPAIRTVLIENVGSGTIAVGEISIVAYKNNVTPELVTQRAHEKIFNFLDRFFTPRDKDTRSNL